MSTTSTSWQTSLLHPRSSPIPQTNSKAVMRIQNHTALPVVTPTKDNSNGGSNSNSNDGDEAHSYPNNVSSKGTAEPVSPPSPQPAYQNYTKPTTKANHSLPLLCSMNSVFQMLLPRRQNHYPSQPQLQPHGYPRIPHLKFKRAMKHKSTEEALAAESLATQNQSSEVNHLSPHSCLLYLIRHGEASHNVLEKQAQKQAKQKAEAEGLSHAEVHARMEAARIAVLTDETLRDARLSQQGQKDAIRSHQTLEMMIQEHDWPRPAKVLVSPLTRTLETADLIFPYEDKDTTICVREELQERQTGKPCDCRQSTRNLCNEFRRFEMSGMQSFYYNEDDLKEEDSNACSSSDDDDDDDNSFSFSRDLFSDHAFSTWNDRMWMSDRGEGSHSSLSSSTPPSQPSHAPIIHRAQSDPVKKEEDKASLRIRTKKLLSLLDESSIAVVTHKGYLREFERGTLGCPEAEEFSNGEIRVYRIHMDSQHSLQSAERIA